jgi:hypothetical protein
MGLVYSYRAFVPWGGIGIFTFLGSQTVQVYFLSCAVKKQRFLNHTAGGKIIKLWMGSTESRFDDVLFRLCGVKTL